MKLYEDLLKGILEKQDIIITISNTETNIEMKCFHAMEKIKNILEDDNLEDEECFKKIEAIVCCFEELGRGCGNRHDFG